LIVRDLLGRAVATLVDEEQMPGDHAALFDGAELPVGMYLYSLHVDGRGMGERRLMLVR
jgi:hypothetical protein